jgi:hypothetical protein
MLGTMNSYAVRTAAFAAGYVASFWAAGQSFGPYLLIPPLAVGAIWLVAQAGFERRRLDVIALATAGAVGATLAGAGLLMSAAVAVWAVLPPLLFATLLQRWLPGYWRGHGDRFRRARAPIARLGGAAALAAAAGSVIQEVTSPGTGVSSAFLQVVRDTVVIVGVTLAVRGVRAARRSRAPREARVVVLR